MSIEKAEVKRCVVQDLGKKFEARIEASTAELHRLEGAAAVLKTEMLKGIESVKSYWTKELHDATITPEIATAVFKALDQCGGCARNLMESAEIHRQIENGKIQGLELASKDCESVFVDEGKKIAGFQEALASGAIVPDDSGRPPLRIVGEHPGQGIAAQRKAESEDLTPATTPAEAVPESVDSSKKTPGGKKAKPASAKLFEG